ncbi:MAG: metallophosphoesterase [Kofleriaceae bacterium]
MRTAAWMIVSLIACDRSKPVDQASPAQVISPTSPADSPRTAQVVGCKLPPIALRRAAPRRLVAIGDLHGDLAGARSALRAAGAIDEHDRWTGGDLVVVQTGDVLDRGEDEQAIFDLLFELETEAAAAGGAVVMLLGNHELMNAAGDLRYVTRGGLNDFDDTPRLDLARWTKIPERARGRMAALGPGGSYAKRLAAHNVVAIVGDTVFSHAGVVPDWATQVDAVNHSARCWLDGQAGGFDAPPIAMTSQDSPVWTRAYGGDSVDCDALSGTLRALGVTRMVVGHTVQETGITSACQGALWRIDVGLGKAYGGPIEVLELTPGSTPKVIRGTR